MTLCQNNKRWVQGRGRVPDYRVGQVSRCILQENHDGICAMERVPASEAVVAPVSEIARPVKAYDVPALQAKVTELRNLIVRDCQVSLLSDGSALDWEVRKLTFAIEHKGMAWHSERLRLERREGVAS